ncbi:hypothetical protein, partial [Pseudomonas sp. 2995-3]|uniref:hypothetical protein n=1 Tax=Pseudomonas sp. 2995-3 TaxID=1712680 RepID=UPI001C43B17B
PNDSSKEEDINMDDEVEESETTEEAHADTHEEEVVEDETIVEEQIYQMDGSTVRPIDEETPGNVVLLTIDDSFNDA